MLGFNYFLSRSNIRGYYFLFQPFVFPFIIPRIAKTKHYNIQNNLTPTEVITVVQTLTIHFLRIIKKLTKLLDRWRYMSQLFWVTSKDGAKDSSVYECVVYACKVVRKCISSMLMGGECFQATCPLTWHASSGTWPSIPSSRVCVTLLILSVNRWVIIIVYHQPVNFYWI